jgi:hypothetical protein
VRKIFGIICLALACFGAFNLAKSLTSGQNQTSSGSAAYDSGRKTGRFLAPIIMGALGLWLLTSESSVRTSPPPRTAPGNLPPAGHPSLKGGGETYASNPARLRLDAIKWLGSRPDMLALFAIALCFGFWMVFFVHPIGGACVLAGIVIALFKTVAEMKGKFWKGDICAGVVISEKPGLVAVFTNLASHGGTRQAIKIIRQPVHRISASVGTRVATVALYRGPAQDGAWKDFFPEIINFAVSDPAEIQRVLDSVSAQEWETLEAYAARIENARAALYRLWGSHQVSVNAPRSILTHKATLITLAVLASLIVAVNLLHFLVRGLNRDRHPIAHSEPKANSSFAAAPKHVPQKEFEQSAAAPAAAPSVSAARSALTSIELNGRIVTVTNLAGRVFENIKLIRADHSGVVYLSEAGGGRIPLNILPVEFLTDIGVPTNWPGSSVMPRPRPTGYDVGSRVSLQWAGRWQSGTVVEHSGPSVQVRMDDPTYRIPLWFGTNIVHPQQ